MLLQRVTVEIGQKKFLQLKRLKILYRGYMLLMILTLKNLLKLFLKKNFKIQMKYFRIEKVIKKKVIICMLSGIVIKNSLNSWTVKKNLI